MLRTLLFFTMLPLLSADLRIMSFNVRYPNPKDGPDFWEVRKELLIDTVRRYKPDLMGTQELFHEQGEYIVNRIPEMAWFGVSRRGNKVDEHMGVFYRKDRLAVLESGNFWLSETPEVAGSISWGMPLPRMVTWARFEDRKTKKQFTYFNTHFTHRGRVDDEARAHSARLIAQRIPANGDFVLTGDFNAPAGGPAYALLVPPLRDAFREAKKREGPEGTFHGFKGTPRQDRIDWILHRTNWKVKSAETITYSKDGRFPSDHFPVIAVFTY